MSCIHLNDEFYSELGSTITTLAISNRYESQPLRYFLESFDMFTLWPSPQNGVERIMRLLRVANHRAYTARYHGFDNLPRFTAGFKHRLHSVDCSGIDHYALIMRVIKSLDFAIYQCMENGQKIAYNDRGYWHHFTDLRDRLMTLAVENSEHYKSAAWGSPLLDNKERW